MFIAIPLLLPIVAVIIIMVSPLWCITQGDYYVRQANKKRLLIFFLSSFALCSTISGILYASASMKVWDKEVWNFMIVKIRHEEKWTTEETRTETYTTGSGKDQQTHVRIVHYTETHGPYWKAQDEYGSEHSIDESEYQKWKKVWGNERKTGTHKGSSAGLSTSITGGIFECDWTKDFDKIFSWAEIHRYKNKVRYSNSVLKYRPPTKEQEKKYPRPADSNNTSPCITYANQFSQQEFDLLCRTSAYLGPKYLIHPILIVFDETEPRNVVEDVLSAWRGPNKNELVTFVSLKGDEVQWCEVHSWVDNTTIHAAIQDELIEGKFSVAKYSNLLLEHVPKKWFKKSFKDFDYLRVEIHFGWWVTAILISISGLVGLFFLVDRRL